MGLGWMLSASAPAIETWADTVFVPGEVLADGTPCTNYDDREALVSAWRLHRLRGGTYLGIFFAGSRVKAVHGDPGLCSCPRCRHRP